MTDIETRNRILMWRMFGRTQWHVIPRRATCHIAGCCHLSNSMSWFQSYMPHCRLLLTGKFSDMSSHIASVTLQGRPTATWWIHCRDPKATCHIAGCSHLAKSMLWSCHIAGCKNSIRHTEHRFPAIFNFFLFS